MQRKADVVVEVLNKGTRFVTDDVAVSVNSIATAHPLFSRITRVLKSRLIVSGDGTISLHKPST